MNPGRRGTIALHLEQFVARLRDDSNFRARLCACPAEQLTANGFDPGPGPGPENLSLAEDSLLVAFDSADLVDFQPPLRGIIPPLELRLLEWGAKKLSLVFGAEATMRQLGGWAQRQGYTALLSPLRYGFASDVGKGRYSNLLRPLNPANAAAGVLRALIVGTAEMEVALAWLSFLFKWDALLGQSLGYPQCCVDAFVARWPVAAKSHQGDMAPLTLLSSGIGPFDWRANIFGRYWGFGLIQHFPCQLTCQESVRLAAGSYSTIREHEPQYAEELSDALAAPALFTDSAGVFIFRDARVELDETEWLMRFDPKRVFATDQNTLFAQTVLSLDFLVGSNDSRVLRVGEGDAVGYLARFRGKNR